MFLRIGFLAVSTAALSCAAMAADFGAPGAPRGAQTVPGAYVTMEAGVRVIRPVPFDPAWVVDDETEIPGGVVYHGAAFYRVPAARALHKAKPGTPEKQKQE